MTPARRLGEGMEPLIMGYCSRTGTRRILSMLRDAGWELMVSATGAHRNEGFAFAIDNGAWTAHQSGNSWDRGLFEELLAKLGSAADWIVCPDVVADAVETRKLYRYWLPKLLDIAPVLVAVQDGMTPWDARDALQRGAAGVFVGGTTDWKLSSLPMWGRFKVLRDLPRPCYLHVGRVNSAKRISACIAAGADSFDGTAVLRSGGLALPGLDRARYKTENQTGMSFVATEAQRQAWRERVGGE